MPRYELHDLISTNGLTEAWVGLDAQTKESVFIKRARSTGDIDFKATCDILGKSYSLQKQISSGSVNTAIARYRQNGVPCFVYPYLDPLRWQKLTPELFWQHFPESLQRVALVIDFLHSQSLVHGDIRLDQFMLKVTNKGIRLTLTDLDFLCSPGQLSDKKVFGTNEHIAPELHTDSIILCVSDNYSFGQSLKHYLQAARQITTNTHVGNEDATAALADRLTVTAAHARPVWLIESLREAGLVNPEDLDSLTLSYFAMHQIQAFRHSRRLGSASSVRSNILLSERQMLIGCPVELRDDIHNAFMRRPATTRRAAKEWLLTEKTVRHGSFVTVSLTPAAVRTLYTKIAPYSGDNRVQSTITSATETSWPDRLELSRKFISQGMPLKAYICFSEYDQSGKNPFREAPQSLTPELHLHRARLSCNLHFSDEARTSYETAMQLLNPDSEEYKQAAFECAQIHALVLDFEGLDKILAKAIKSNGEVPHSESELGLRRIAAWALGSKGEIERSDASLRGILADAISHEKHLAASATYNGLGILEWRRGRITEAQKHFEQAMNIAKTHEGQSQAMTSAWGLAKIAQRQLRMGTSLKLIKEGLRDVTDSVLYTKLPSLYSLAVVISSELGEPQLAELWLQRYLNSMPLGTSHGKLAEYYYMRGWLNFKKSSFSSATDDLLRAIDISGTLEDKRLAIQSYLCLAQIGIFRGLTGLTDDCLANARQYAIKSGDKSAILDVEFLKLVQSTFQNEACVYAPGWVDYVKKLIELESYAAAQEAVLYVLLVEQPARLISSILLFSFCRHLAQDSDSIIGQILGIMFDGINEQSDSQSICGKLYKPVLSKCVDSHQIFLGCLVCQRIADSYEESQRSRIATKFLRMAQQYCSELPNSQLGSLLNSRIRLIAETGSYKNRMLNALTGVAPIFATLSSQNDVQERILRFVLEETGAERAVLLLKSSESDKLRVRSSLGCDVDDLADVERISQHLAEQSSQDRKIVTVDDASSTQQLRKFRSIVAYNIRSVCCIPIDLEGGSQAVLYLDHHSIPSLFDEEDVAYATAMSQFLSAAFSAAKSYRTLQTSRERLSTTLSREGLRGPFITESPVMMELLEQLTPIAHSKTSVLIQGESGTGKEIIAELIHQQSPRSNEALVKVNCAAFPESLVESELFGVARGTATGVEARQGKFESADGGTLFMDEVSDMPLSIQAKVLRVLEYQRFERVGSNRAVNTDIRFIYASNRDLEELCNGNEFRRDLLYRINTITLNIPPLRERREDIPLLILHFGSMFQSDPSKRPSFSDHAMRLISEYSWPGNVRELRNFVEKLCLLRPGARIEIESLPAEFDGNNWPYSGKTDKATKLTKATIVELLDKHRWNIAAVARELDIPESTLKYQMIKFNIRRPK